MSGILSRRRDTEWWSEYLEEEDVRNPRVNPSCIGCAESRVNLLHLHVIVGEDPTEEEEWSQLTELRHQKSYCLKFIMFCVEQQITLFQGILSGKTSLTKQYPIRTAVMRERIAAIILSTVLWLKLTSDISNDLPNRRRFPVDSSKGGQKVSQEG